MHVRAASPAKRFFFWRFDACVTMKAECEALAGRFSVTQRKKSKPTKPKTVRHASARPLAAPEPWSPGNFFVHFIDIR
jgi:hypothetical protein